MYSKFCCIVKMYFNSILKLLYVYSSSRWERKIIIIFFNMYSIILLLFFLLTICFEKVLRQTDWPTDRPDRREVSLPMFYYFTIPIFMIRIFYKNSIKRKLKLIVLIVLMLNGWNIHIYVYEYYFYIFKDKSTLDLKWSKQVLR